MDGYLGFADKSPLTQHGKRLVGRVSRQERNFSEIEPRLNDMLDGTSVVDIEGGAGHTLVLTSSGHVMSFGRAVEGYLGREVPLLASARQAKKPSSDEQDDLVLRWQPVRIEKLLGKRITGICASETMSLAWDDEGALYEWGTRFQEGKLSSPGADASPSSAAATAGGEGKKVGASEEAGGDGAGAGAGSEDKEKEKEDREFEMAQIVLPGLAVEAPRDSVRRMVVKSAMQYLAAGTKVGIGSSSTPASSTGGSPTRQADPSRASSAATESTTAPDRTSSSASHGGDDRTGSHRTAVSPSPAAVPAPSTGSVKADGTADGTHREDGDEGVLGAQLSIEHVPIPRVHRQLYRLGVKVQHVAAGYRHVVVVDSEGRAWSQGFNDRGQLGLRHRFPLPHFRQIREGNEAGDVPRGLEHYAPLPKIRKAACGASHTLLLDDTGRVWACGSGGLGQLGLRVARTRLEPARLAAFPDLRAADRLEKGRVAALAGGAAGSSLGMSLAGPDRGAAAVLVPPRARVVDIACGQNHSLAVTEDGTLWGWGHSEYHQMGALPTMSNGERILRSAHFYVPRALGITQDVLAVLADDGHGMPHEEEPEEVEAAAGDASDGAARPVLPRGDWHATGGASLPLRGSMAGQDRLVAAVKAGGLMGAALTREGRLVTFGWQGWGVLGRGTVSAQIAFSPVAAPLPFHRVVAFGAGDSHMLCACPSLGDRHGLSMAPLLRDPELLSMAGVSLWPAKRAGYVKITKKLLEQLTIGALSSDGHGAASGSGSGVAHGEEGGGLSSSVAIALSPEMLSDALAAAQRHAADTTATHDGGARSGALERARRSAEQRERRMRQELQDMISGHADSIVGRRSNRDPDSYTWVSRGKFYRAAQRLESRLGSSRSKSAAHAARARAEATASRAGGDRRSAMEAARGHVTDVGGQHGSESSSKPGATGTSYQSGGIDAQLARGLAPAEPVGWLVLPNASRASADSVEDSAEGLKAQACVPSGGPLLVHGEILLARCPLLADAASRAARAAVLSPDGKARVSVRVPEVDEELAQAAARTFLHARGGLRWKPGQASGDAAASSDSGEDAAGAGGNGPGSKPAAAVGGLSLDAASELREAAKKMRQKRMKKKQRAAAAKLASAPAAADADATVSTYKKPKPTRRTRRGGMKHREMAAGKGYTQLPPCVVCARLSDAAAADGTAPAAASRAGGAPEGSQVELEIVLPGANDRTLGALVTYLYMDTVRVRGNTRGELGALAQRLGLSRLHAICAGKISEPVGTKAASSSEAAIGNDDADGHSASRFRADMRNLLCRAERAVAAASGRTTGGSHVGEGEDDEDIGAGALLPGQAASALALVKGSGDSLPEDSPGAGDSAAAAGGDSAGEVGKTLMAGARDGIGCHTGILSRFDFFKAALVGGMAAPSAAGEVRSVSLPEVSQEAVRRVVRWIYDGDSDAAIGDSGDTALETLVVAKQLMLARLCDDVEEAVVEAVDDENAGFLLELAEMHGFHRLEKACKAAGD